MRNSLKSESFCKYCKYTWQPKSFPGLKSLIFVIIVYQSSHFFPNEATRQISVLAESHTNTGDSVCFIATLYNMKTIQMMNIARLMSSSFFSSLSFLVFLCASAFSNTHTHIEKKILLRLTCMKLYKLKKWNFIFSSK